VDFPCPNRRAFEVCAQLKCPQIQAWWFTLQVETVCLLMCHHGISLQMDQSILIRQQRRRVIVRANFLVGVATNKLCILVKMGSYGCRELDPFYE
jgi:hypothetical protein